MKEINNSEEKKLDELESVVGGTNDGFEARWALASENPIELRNQAVGCPKIGCRKENGEPALMSYEGTCSVPKIGRVKGGYAYRFLCPNCKTEYAKCEYNNVWFVYLGYY